MSDMSRQCGKCAKLMSPRATHAARCLKKGDITRRRNRVRDLLKEFGSMACMSHVLEKASLAGEAPFHRPGDGPNMYNGEGCAAEIAVTCPFRDVYARLADGMSPAFRTLLSAHACNWCSRNHAEVDCVEQCCAVCFVCFVFVVLRSELT